MAEHSCDMITRLLILRGPVTASDVGRGIASMSIDTANDAGLSSSAAVHSTSEFPFVDSNDGVGDNETSENTGKYEHITCTIESLRGELTDSEHSIV